MKIICDCGKISEFIKQDHYNEEDGEYCQIEGDIELFGEHDKVWIECNCGNNIWIFT